MSELPLHTGRCPICGKETHNDPKASTMSSLRHRHYKQQPCQVFLCYNPLAGNPFHYYACTVLNSDLAHVVVEEFSVDLGSKPVIFTNDYLEGKCRIRVDKDKDPLEVAILMAPDFPELISLKKKIRTAITFS